MAGTFAVEGQIARKNQRVRVPVNHLRDERFDQLFAVGHDLAIAVGDAPFKARAVIGQLRRKVVQVGGYKEGYGIGGLAQRGKRHEQRKRQQQQERLHGRQLLSADS